MVSNPEKALVVRRLQLLLKYLTERLELFLESDGADSKGLIFIDIDEAKTAAKCLVELNLFEDAQELAEAWIRLHKWAVGPVMNEVLSAITSSDPER